MRIGSLITPFGLLAILVGCAGASGTRPAALTSPLNGQYDTGKVVSVRPIDPGAASPAVQQIFAALQLPGAPVPAGQAEVIIRKDDGEITSMVQPAGRFEPGERLAIVGAAATVLQPE